jgi:hypothetical protein
MARPFTGRMVERCSESVDVRTVLEDTPVAVLVPENGGQIRMGRTTCRMLGSSSGRRRRST